MARESIDGLIGKRLSWGETPKDEDCKCTWVLGVGRIWNPACKVHEPKGPPRY